VLVESWVMVATGFVESWIGVLDLGVSMTRTHDSASGTRLRRRGDGRSETGGEM
jgi:hypothetical protein